MNDGYKGKESIVFVINPPSLKRYKQRLQSGMIFLSKNFIEYSLDAFVLGQFFITMNVLQKTLISMGKV